jgi:YVTN family beta-propeller protein
MRLTTMRYFARFIGLFLLLGIPLAASTVRIYVSNRNARVVSVIDPVTDKVVQTIEDIEVPRWIDFSPDGKWVYVTNEGEEVIDVVDQKTGKIIKKIAVSGHPNMVSASKDGRRIIVCIRSAPGAVDVVDTDSLTIKKTIPVKGGLHDGYVTPDGKYAVVGSISGRIVTVIDLQSGEIAWELKMGDGVRPMAIETNTDGSTRRIFVQLTSLRGFAVVDFATHQVVDRIKFPDEPKWYDEELSDLDAAHGIEVAPDGKTLWVNSTSTRTVFVYSLPDLKLVGQARVGRGPGWITFTPDSKKAYISAEGALSVVDAKTMKETARIEMADSSGESKTLVLP